MGWKLLWFKNEANIFNESGVTSRKVTKEDKSIYAKTVFVETKIFRIWTMGVITLSTYILMSLVKKSLIFGG